MDRDGVKEKFDITPEQIVDFLALTGRQVGQHSGRGKVRPENRGQMAAQWGSLEIMAHADEVGGKIGEYLRAALDQIPLSRELATIRLDLELEYKPRDLKRREEDRKRRWSKRLNATNSTAG